jgi:TolA-binding protein
MKKVLLVILLSFLFLSAISPAQAAIQKTIKVPAILQGPVEQLQKAIDSLITKTDNHEARIVELEKKVATLEENISVLESKSVIPEANNNTQQSLILKEDSGGVLQQDHSLYQKLNEFLEASSNKLSADDFIVANTPEIKDLGDVKLK